MYEISLSTSVCCVSRYVPWNAPGRKAERQFCVAVIGYPPGHMAMNPGRFWFSEPRPYVTHEPKLGRHIRPSPQFMSHSDGS